MNASSAPRNRPTPTGIARRTRNASASSARKPSARRSRPRVAGSRTAPGGAASFTETAGTLSGTEAGWGGPFICWAQPTGSRARSGAECHSQAKSLRRGYGENMLIDANNVRRAGLFLRALAGARAGRRISSWTPGASRPRRGLSEPRKSSRRWRAISSTRGGFALTATPTAARAGLRSRGTASTSRWKAPRRAEAVQAGRARGLKGSGCASQPPATD